MNKPNEDLVGVTPGATRETDRLMLDVRSGFTNFVKYVVSIKGDKEVSSKPVLDVETFQGASVGFDFVSGGQKKYFLAVAREIGGRVPSINVKITRPEEKVVELSVPINIPKSLVSGSIYESLVIAYNLFDVNDLIHVYGSTGSGKSFKMAEFAAMFSKQSTVFCSYEVASKASKHMREEINHENIVVIKNSVESIVEASNSEGCVLVLDDLNHDDFIEVIKSITNKNITIVYSSQTIRTENLGKTVNIYKVLDGTYKTDVDIASRFIIPGGSKMESEPTQIVQINKSGITQD